MDFKNWFNNDITTMLNPIRRLEGELYITLMLTVRRVDIYGAHQHNTGPSETSSHTESHNTVLVYTQAIQGATIVLSAY